MSYANSLTVFVQVGMADADAAELDLLTRQLMDELLEQDIESAELARSGAAPAGTKSADAITIGSIAVAVLPAILPKIIEACQAWALRGQGRTVKFKGKIAGQDIEFEGNAEDLKKILSVLGPSTPAAPAAAG